MNIKSCRQHWRETSVQPQSECDDNRRRQWEQAVKRGQVKFLWAFCHLQGWERNICFQRIVAESLNNVGEDASSVLQECYVPFSFDSVKENSEFQIVEIVYDCEYRYGFEYNDESIVTEWCYRKNLKTNRTAIIFERTAESVAWNCSCY